MGNKPQEKKDDQKAEQNPPVKIPPELKAELDKMKIGNETYADVIRRLIVAGSVKEASKEGMITLRMPETNFMQLLVVQPSTTFRDVLLQARM